jgi:hypothetical protein
MKILYLYFLQAYACKKHFHHVQKGKLKHVKFKRASVFFIGEKIFEGHVFIIEKKRERNILKRQNK